MSIVSFHNISVIARAFNTQSNLSRRQALVSLSRVFSLSQKGGIKEGFSFRLIPKS
jgi:hypothetical protein